MFNVIHPPLRRKSRSGSYTPSHTLTHFIHRNCAGWWWWCCRWCSVCSPTASVYYVFARWVSGAFTYGIHRFCSSSSRSGRRCCFLFSSLNTGFNAIPHLRDRGTATATATVADVADILCACMRAYIISGGYILFATIFTEIFPECNWTGARFREGSIESPVIQLPLKFWKRT